MKPKLLIIDFEYHPIYNANTNIVKRLSSFLKEKYDIVIATQNSMNAPSYENEHGIQIYRTPVHHTSNVSKNSLDDYIKLLVFKIANFIRESCIDEKSAFFFIKDICNFINLQEFDLILSFSNPFTSHYCASILSKKYNIPWIAYYLDPFYTNATLPPNHFTERKKIEEELLGNAIRIIMTYPTNENYQRFRFKYKDKIVKAEMPGINFDNFIGNDDKERKACKCYYIGNLYKDIRDPASAVKIFSMLDEFDIELNFVGGWYGPKMDFEGLSSKNIVFLGTKNVDELVEIYRDADILLNIGNLIDNQMPSKIFEYISTGKPIINIYKVKNCPTLKYLCNYPLALNIFEDDLLKNTNQYASIIRNFCFSKMGKTVSAEYIKNSYNANTDNMVCEFLCSQINDVLR